jgi:squalene synthase HpnC
VEKSLPEAQKYCRDLTHSHYENFTVGSYFLPKKLRQHICNVYAFSRFADDLADEEKSLENSMKKLEDWDQKLSACYKGDFQHPIFVALAETIQTFQIPQQLFQNLLIAFKQDQLVNRYETFENLLGYCQNSANPVGRIYLYLFKLADEERFIYSDSICTALQLTNFWQDLKIDWEKSRIYIPSEDFKKYNCSEPDLEKNEISSHFRELIKFEVNRTQEMFDFGKRLLTLIPKQPKFEIQLFIRGGEAILESIRNLDYNTLGKRPTVGKLKKATLIASSWWQNRK